MYRLILKESTPSFTLAFDMTLISYFDQLDQRGNMNVDILPDECPTCHSKVIPTQHGALFHDTSNGRTGTIRVFMRCPNQKCHTAFIAVYEVCPHPNNSRLGYFRYSEPQKKQYKSFTDAINALSPNFSELYNQSYAAEQHGLDQICGAGYRKSLEFLIKDYAISRHSDKADTIKRTHLGQVIELYVLSPQVKAVAARATWLGNDETHYARKWIGQDLTDLKRLIDLTMHWIEMEELTAQVVDQMPTSGPSLETTPPESSDMAQS